MSAILMHAMNTTSARIDELARHLAHSTGEDVATTVARATPTPGATGGQSRGKV
jgi:hypothetical protein